MTNKIQIRRDSAANWVSVNSILAAGEQGFEIDTGRYKIGDGTNAWNSLSYINNKLTPTSIKTSAYTAAASDLVLCDTSTGATPSGFTVTLPAAPPDKSIIGIKMIAQAGTNITTITTSGSGKFNTSTGTTTYLLKLLGQTVTLQYQSSNSVWIVVSTDISLTQLDNRYASATPSGSFLPLAGGTMSGPIAMGSSKVTGLANGTAPQDAAAFGQITAANAAALPLAGGTMTGPIIGFQDKGAEVYDVKAYGAIGNGSTDDTTAINAAIAAAATAGGGIVYLPLGTYKTSASIVITADNIILEGTGWGSIIQPASGSQFDAVSTAMPTFIGTTASPVTLTSAGNSISSLNTTIAPVVGQFVSIVYNVTGTAAIAKGTTVSTVGGSSGNYSVTLSANFTGTSGTGVIYFANSLTSHTRNGLTFRDFAIDCSNVTGSTAGQGNALHCYGMRYSRIENLYFKSTPNFQIILDGDQSTINNFGYDNVISKCVFDGGPATGSGVLYTQCEGNDFIDNRFKWCGSGTNAGQGLVNIAQGAGITTGQQLYLNSGYNYVAGNVFGKGGNYTSAAIQTYNAGPCRIIGNRFDQVRYQAVILNAGNHEFAFNALGSPASANTGVPAIQLGNSNNRIVGNSFDNTAGSTHHTYCVSESGGPFTGNIISNNNFIAGVTGTGLINLNATSTVVIHNNYPSSLTNTQTTNYSAHNGEIVLANAVGGAITITSPSTVNYATVTVKKIDSTVNTVTFTPASGTVDGQTTYIISTQYQSVQFICDGTNWWVV